MSVRRAIWLAAGFGFALMLAFGAFLVRETTSVSDRVDAVFDVYDPAAQQTAVLDTALSDMERGVAGFLITGEAASLEPYVDGSRRADIALRALSDLVEDDPRLAAVVSRLTRDGQVWNADTAAPIIDARRADDLPRAVSIFRDPARAVLFESIEADVATLGAGIADRRAAVFGALTNQTYHLLLSVLTTMILLMGALAAGYALAKRGVLAPLDHLRRQIRTAARVDNHVTIAGTGPAELRLLGGDVEELRRNLVIKIDEATAAREALHDEAPVVALIQAELATGRIVAAPGLAIHGEMQPAEGVLAGDLWDTGWLSRTGEAALILADVSGHGAKAGLAAMRLKETIRVLLRGRDLESIAAGTAAQFQGEDWYATLVALGIDPGSGTVRYINAGHPAPMVIDERGALVQTLTRTSLPLGIGWEAEIATMQLDHGHTILMFSDGLLESRDEAGVELGEELLASWLRAMPDTQRDPVKLVPWLLGAARERAGAWRNDDITVVAVKRL